MKFEKLSASLCSKYRRKWVYIGTVKTLKMIIIYLHWITSVVQMKLKVKEWSITPQISEIVSGSRQNSAPQPAAVENAPSALIHIEFLYGGLLLDLVDQSIEAFSVFDCHWAEQIVASMYAKCSTIIFEQPIYLTNPLIPSTISLGNTRVEIPISISYSPSPVQIQPAMVMANLHNANSIPSNSILNLGNYCIVKLFPTIQFNLIFWIEIKDEE